MAIEIIITDAGRIALVNAENTGTDPVTITQVGLSQTAVVPLAGAVALPGEFKRLGAVGGEVVADDTIHLTVTDDSPDDYTLRSLALYLADGTLFAIYGQAGAILEKAAASFAALAIDIVFADIDAALLTFGDANFSLPPATTERKGVVELATVAEAQAGIDALRALTPATAKAAILGWLLAQDGPLSELDSDTVDGYHAAAFAKLAGAVFDGQITAPTVALTLANAYFGGSGAGAFINFDANDVIFHNRARDAFEQIINGLLQFDVRHDGWAAARSGFLAANNMVWHAGNDGSGSAMDADLLDGRHASGFAFIEQFAAHFGNPGFQKLPGGLILQFGASGHIDNSGVRRVDFNIAFPNGPLLGFASNGAGGPPSAFHGTGNMDVAGMYVYSSTSSGVPAAAGTAFNWLALGI